MLALLSDLYSELEAISVMVIEFLSQMSYSLVVILELNSVSEIQYKGIIIIDDKLMLLYITHIYR